MTKKILKQIIRISLSIAALWIISKKVDVVQAFEYLKNTNFILIVCSLLSFTISKILAAHRVNALYRTQGVFMSQWLNAKLTFLAMFYNLFIPLVGGEGYKSWWIHKKYNTPVKGLLWAALLDRGSGLASLGIVTLLVFQWSSFEFEYKLLSLSLIPFIYLGHWIVNYLFFKSFLPAWFQSSILSLLVQALQALTAFLVVLALGVEQLQIEYVFVFMLASFAYVVPIVGAREMAFVFGSKQLGLNMELSLAIGLLFYVALALSSLAGYWFVLFPKSLETSAEVSKST